MQIDEAFDIVASTINNEIKDFDTGLKSLFKKSKKIEERIFNENGDFDMRIPEIWDMLDIKLSTTLCLFKKIIKPRSSGNLSGIKS